MSRRFASGPVTEDDRCFVEWEADFGGAIQLFENAATKQSMMNVYWGAMGELSDRYREVETMQRRNPAATVYVAVYYSISNENAPAEIMRLYTYDGMDIGDGSLVKGFLLQPGMHAYTLRIDALAASSKPDKPPSPAPAATWQTFYQRLYGSLYTQGGNIADAALSLGLLNGLTVTDMCMVLMKLRQKDKFAFDKLQQALDWYSVGKSLNVSRLRAVFDAVNTAGRVGDPKAIVDSLNASKDFLALPNDQKNELKACLCLDPNAKTDVSSPPTGAWRVRVQNWTWIYTFDPNGNVGWRDPQNGRTGQGKWQFAGSKMITTWSPSATVEEWELPLNDKGQKGVAKMKEGVFPLLADRS